MRGTVLTLLFLAATAPPALAQKQQQGVIVDPDSPAGAEYAIPLEEARRQAAGGAGDGGAAPSAAPPLFGTGIEREASSASGVANDGSTGRDRSAERVGAGSGTQGKGSEDASQRDGIREGARGVVPDTGHAAAIEAASTDGSDGPLTVGIAAAVLAAGLLVGLLLRRLLGRG